MVSGVGRSFHTEAARPDIAGFNIFALRGMMVDVDREIQLNGLEAAAAQQGLRNINGNNAELDEGR